ncbi:uncharacterized protein LOC143235597 [Tachypleus tridentatus]|uniref:uncharacterized protein LOC143235597 n=1 Tax=Tachypleus tridentatus TaxID=6853 RepID=UPI003FD21DA0
MFHHFQVQKKDGDFFRSLWIEDSSKDVVDYQMKVNLFGVVSSPSCAISGLRFLAYDNMVESLQATCFIQEGFYVDDGLKSVKTDSEAIHLIKEIQTIYIKENIHVHIFLSNKQEVLDRAPKTENLYLPEEGDPIGECWAYSGM